MPQVFNPYLPLNEYVPDGEPRVFGDRVYIYGSHDAIGATAYCPGDYVTWSAPVDDLKNWRYEGVIYRKNQDPSNADSAMQLWAPDVTMGPDGRYYLYYCFSFYPEIGVAVADSPVGPFEFLDHVHYADGRLLREFMPFDPAILNDNGRPFIYYGFTPGGEKPMEMPKFTEEQLAEMPENMRKMASTISSIKFGDYSMVAELEPDMVTLRETPRQLIPSERFSKGTSFEGHGFFEASSIRKIGEKYYFVYSSHKSHELCYATSDKPDRDFVYGGTIISNGDIGLNGREIPTRTIGNNHGGIAVIKDRPYIFYHIQTDGSEYSRQGCAEPIDIKEDGSIAQVECTSCGLNGGPLLADGSYPASIACFMRCPKLPNDIDFNRPIMKEITRVTETYNESYVTDIVDGSVIGYKYFSFLGASMMTVEIRGAFDGAIIVSTDTESKNQIGEIEVQLNNKNDWRTQLIPIADVSGKQALYFTFKGQGNLDLKGFSFVNL